MVEDLGVEVVAEPQGRLKSMFFPVSGTNTGVEWKGCNTQQVPFDMGGIEGLAAQAENKWMVLVLWIDNKMKALRCQFMTKVTGDFPMYDVTKAVQEMKDDAPGNKILH